MAEKWTAEDVKEHFKVNQLAGNFFGADKETLKKILDWMNSEDEDWLNIIGTVFPRRHGALLFMTLTEHIWFPPSTERNFDFFLINMTWNGMGFFIFSVPFVYLPRLDILAEKCGVRLVPGTVGVFGSEGFKLFPIKGKNTYNLENTKGHPIYRRGLKTVIKGMSEKEEFYVEDQLLDKIHNHNFDFSDYY